MFKMSWFGKADIVGTIKVRNLIGRLGPTTDINGCRWDIHAIFGCGTEQVVCACPMSNLHPYFYDTSSNFYGLVHQTWHPYKVEIVKE